MRGANSLFTYTTVKNMSVAPPESAIYIADLDRVLQSHLLKGSTRRVIALLYGLQLTVREASIISKIPIQTILEEEEEFMEIYEAIENGYHHTTLPYRKEGIVIQTLEDWLDSVEAKEVHPLNPPDLIRQQVALILSPYDELAEEMILQYQTPQRREDIMNYTSDNIYPDHDTSFLIENPTRRYEYVNRLRSGKDYFREQDLRNGVKSMEEEEYGYL